MNKKMVIGFIVLAFVLSGVVFGMGGKPPKELIQEYKTYVSKYGFSVSYPAGWHLEEQNNVKPSEYELEGYKNFIMYKENMGIDFIFYNEMSSGSENHLVSKNSKDKMLLMAKEYNIYVGKKGDVIKVLPLENGPDVLLIYYNGKRLRRALFYIKKTDAMVVVNISEKAQNEFRKMVDTIRFIYEE